LYPHAVRLARDKQVTPTKPAHSGWVTASFGEQRFNVGRLQMPALSCEIGLFHGLYAGSPGGVSGIG
jgi:hypothetical protein